MKHFKFMLTGMSALSLLALSSCMDDAYDLSDIDTTARLQVKELTIPLNLDHITLEQIINLDESSEIVKETDANGNLIYAIKKEGTFKSDPINVAQFTTSKPSILLSPPFIYLRTSAFSLIMYQEISPRIILSPAIELSSALKPTTLTSPSKTLAR